MSEPKDEALPVTVPKLSFTEIRDALDAQPLFDNKTWRLSPQAFPISRSQLKEIEAIGQACLEFFQALEILYRRSMDGKSLLRNRDLKAPWVAAYLNRGKPENLLRHANSSSLRGRLPFVLRPDLLLTEEGFVLSEMDSVPGGIGLTAFLNRLYEQAGDSRDPAIIGGKDLMLEAFYRNIAALAPAKPLPFIAILVSDEAETYRPEMEWLAEELQRLGKRVFTFHPGDVMPLGDTLCVDMGGNPQQIDVIYRFWELFDIAEVPIARFVLEALKESAVAITPPMKPYQEEKLNLALFHHHMLESFWRENLSKRAFRTLQKVIPRSWVMDPVELPPNAVLDAPYIGGKPITRWPQLAEASQKERNLIIKLSGFHEDAWGARSVTLGSDSSRAEWEDAIQQAVDLADHSLHILQDYHKPKRLSHPVFSSDESKQNAVYSMQGRLRLCPYYFVEGDKSRLIKRLFTG